MSAPGAWTPTGLPKFTITVTPARPGTVCGIGHDHPAEEHYEFRGGGGPLNRCAEHGGDTLRKKFGDAGHTVIDRTAS